jgi:hypothetical protein
VITIKSFDVVLDAEFMKKLMRGDFEGSCDGKRPGISPDKPRIIVRRALTELFKKQ